MIVMFSKQIPEWSTFILTCLYMFFGVFHYRKTPQNLFFIKYNENSEGSVTFSYTICKIFLLFMLLNYIYCII